MNHSVQVIESEIPGDMTCDQYRKLVVKPKRRTVRSTIRKITKVIR